jgi:ATP-dependent DNA helicase RecG
VNCPDWADEQLSSELPVIRARGEGAKLEFKSEFPKNAQDLGQTIAAFSSSGGGMILIGVSNGGDVIGIPDAQSAQGRDNLIRRIEGVCKGPVKPAVTPTVAFAVENRGFVLVVTVPRGSEPVYYCQGKPYVRHLTSSRPAEPHEVIDLIRRWRPDQLAEAADESPKKALASKLSSILSELLTLLPEIEHRNVNPWLDQIHAQLRYAAEELRSLALSDFAEQEGITKQLQDLAKEADAAANHKHYLGRESYEEFLRKLRRVEDKASTMMATVVESSEITVEWAPQAVRALRLESKHLLELASRADEMARSGLLTELQQEASQIGERILRLILLGLNHAPKLNIEALRSVGRTLHLMETQRVYLDGGASAQNILSSIEHASEELARLADSN